LEIVEAGLLQVLCLSCLKIYRYRCVERVC